MNVGQASGSFIIPSLQTVCARFYSVECLELLVKMLSLAAGPIPVWFSYPLLSKTPTVSFSLVRTLEP